MDTEELRELSVVAIVQLDDPAIVLDLGRALVAGGLHAVEVAFGWPAGPEAVGLLPTVEGLRVGAGDIQSPAQVDLAASSGASFISCPRVDEAVIDRCVEFHLPLQPTVAGRDDVARARELGCHVLRTEAAGPLAVERLALGARGARFVPTGDIPADEIGSYLIVEEVVAVATTAIAPPAVVAAHDWASITANATAAMSQVAEVRSERLARLAEMTQYLPRVER